MTYSAEYNTIFGFEDYASARAARDRIADIASTLGHVKVDDLDSIIPGLHHTEAKHRIDAGWTLDAVSEIEIDMYGGGPYNIYRLVFPPTDFPKLNKVHPVRKNIPNESHPIYINVTTADMDDPDCLICSVLTHAQKIRDRDIFINIY